jgi:hypothetical protein
MKNLLYLSMLVCSLVFAIACRENAADSTLPNKRLEFIKGKNMDVLKSDYRSLADDVKKELWVDKIHQIQSQAKSLSEEQLAIIKELEVELTRNGSKFTIDNEILRNLGVKLASIMPREDFLNMFATLDNYKLDNSNKLNPVCEECIIDIQNEVSIINSLNTRAIPCSCKWTCGSGVKTTSNCNATSIGCGWLWLQSCKQRDCVYDC